MMINILEINKVYNENCVGNNGMCLIDDKSIDLILCDLPYGITSSKWDSLIPFDKLWEQYERIIKDKGAIVFTATQPFTTSLINSKRELFKYCWVWIKTKASNHVNAKLRPMGKHEDIVVFSKGTIANGSPRIMNYYPQGLKRIDKVSYRPSPKFGNIQGVRPSHKNSYIQEYEGYPNTVLEFSNPNNKTIHPTQKPLELFEYLIKTYTNEGETVLDNCMGSFTTAIACINTNRNYIGFENDDKYFALGQERVRLHNEGLIINK